MRVIAHVELRLGPISIRSISSGPTVVRVMRVQLKTGVKKKKHTLIKGKKTWEGTSNNGSHLR